MQNNTSKVHRKKDRQNQAGFRHPSNQAPKRTEAAAKSKRPKAIEPQFNRIPSELRQREQWVVWRYLRKGDKWTKIPYNAETGNAASTTDPQTWTTFNRAKAAYQRGNYDGVGYVFSGDDPFTGVDFDHCFDAVDGKKTIKPAANRWVENFDSYTEYSVSGEGLHAIIKAKPSESFNNHDEGVEVYDRARYFTFTGESYHEEPKPIAERQDVAETFINKYSTKKKQTSREQMREEEERIKQQAQDALKWYEEHKRWLRDNLGLDNIFEEYNHAADIEEFILKLDCEPTRDCSAGRQWHHRDSNNDGSVVEFVAPDGVKLAHIRTHRLAEKYGIRQGATLNASQLRAIVEYGDTSKESFRKLANKLREEGFGNKATDNSTALLDGKLSLTAEPAERGKVKVTARAQDGSVIHRDVINLDKRTDRDEFIKALSLADEESKTIQAALLAIDVKAIAALDAAKVSAAEERVMSKVLSDGRIIEQIAGLKFAVYEPTTDTFTYAESVEDNGVTYKPSENTGDMFLPDALTEYGTEAELDRRIEEVYRRYCDAPDRAIKVACKYVRMSYITDLLNEVPYLKAVGEPGSGKSRFCGVGASMSYHPLSIVSITQAVLFRLVDECAPTLFIDEWNPKIGGEDVEGIMQVLLAGFQRVAKVYRTGEPDENGKRKVEQYSAFGAKFLAGLKSSGSDALESRCFEVRLEKTTRTDITFRTSERMKKDCAEVASMLLLWRLRSLKKDFETLLDAAEDDLKKYAVDPRDIQISTPLYALIEDADLKKEFADSLEKRTRTTRSEKLEGFEGKIVRAVYDAIYDSNGETVNQRRPFDVGEPIYEASTTDIKESLSDEYPDLKDGYIGKKLTELGFTKARLSKRSYNGKANEKRERNAVVFDPDKLTKVFVGYGLPLPGEAPAQMELVEMPDQVPFMVNAHPEPEKAGKRR